MSTFKAGDSVIIYPSKEIGIVTSVRAYVTNYPITVSVGREFEGSYTADGYRYLNNEFNNECRIELATTASKPTQPNYWTIVRANSSFVHLSHPKLQDKLIPIHIIKAIEIIGTNVCVYTSEHPELNLGPILIQHVADILFSHEINSI